MSSRPSSLSPVKIKIPVASADMRRHSDTLRAANAAMKERFTGRKQNKRKRILLSSRRSPKVGANGGENARASVLRSEGVCSPVKIKIPVASADMRRHSDTLRGAQRRRKRGLRGENRISGANSVVFPSYAKDIVFSRTCAGKRHLKSRERGDESGVHGEKTE